MADWKVGDWAVFDRRVVQIKEIREGGGMTVSDGMFETSGMLAASLRPLTLRNKAAAEWFDYHYNELRKIKGEIGFNYPDISRYFNALSLQAMDGSKEDDGPYNSARRFLEQARSYTPVIDGVSLFRG